MNATLTASILIVNNDLDSIDQLQNHLKPSPYRIDTAYDGEEAMEKIRLEPPDLVLLHLHVPKLSGFEICRRLKRDLETQFIPIVITTPLQHMEDKVKAIELGADELLSSPINRIELTTRIRSLLRLKSLHRNLDRSENILFSLVAALEAKDRFTRGHSDRVAEIAVSLGENLRLPDNDLNLLQRGGLLHDIGKIGIRESVLLKTNGLTDEEFDHIKTHPVQGYDICVHLKSLEPCLSIIRSHHERIDGKGYPDKLQGDDIPLFARITAVADSFDAMTHNRPYRDAMPAAKALSLFSKERDRGQWDVKIVDALLEVKAAGA